MSQIAVQFRYQPIGAAAQTDLLIAADQDRIDRAIAILGNVPDTEAGDTAKLADPLPNAALAFIAVLHQVNEQLFHLTKALGAENEDHCDPKRQDIPAMKLSDLRALGSSPKQIARLLGCQAGFFDEGNETICLFSPVRFKPAGGFFYTPVDDF